MYIFLNAGSGRTSCLLAKCLYESRQGSPGHIPLPGRQLLSQVRAVLPVYFCGPFHGSVSVKHWMWQWQWWEVVDNCPSLLGLPEFFSLGNSFDYVPRCFRHDCPPCSKHTLWRLLCPDWLPATGCPCLQNCSGPLSITQHCLSPTCLYHFTLGCFFPIVPWEILDPSHCSWKFQTLPLPWIRPSSAPSCSDHCYVISGLLTSGNHSWTGRFWKGNCLNYLCMIATHCGVATQWADNSC